MVLGPGGFGKLLLLAELGAKHLCCAGYTKSRICAVGESLVIYYAHVQASGLGAHRGLGCPIVLGTDMVFVASHLVQVSGSA